MKTSNILLLLAAALAPAPAAPAQSASPAAAPQAPAQDPIVQPGSLEADRRAILAMAGTFRVRFDMRETTSWRGDYTPLAAATSGGHEVVRVIADTGRFISLQHLLVVDNEGTPMVIKHWRQDWTYEPGSVLVYAGPNQWRTEAVPAERRRGAWSQTVWQVDDSPRYGAVGRWTTTGGVQRWRSDWTWRPLARRDAIRNPRYDRYLAINRHSPTPDGGWIHWQDNEKMGQIDGALVPFVQESVLNTYRPFSEFNVGAADAYWAATRDYWAAVRAEWTRVEREHRGINIREEAQTGTVISGRLLEMGNEIQAGRMTTPAAVAEALRLIRGATGGR
jgi:hypothetical protein